MANQITQSSMDFANKMASGSSEGILCAEHESGFEKYPCVVSYQGVQSL